MNGHGGGALLRLLPLARVVVLLVSATLRVMLRAYRHLCCWTLSLCRRLSTGGISQHQSQQPTQAQPHPQQQQPQQQQLQHPRHVVQHRQLLLRLQLLLLACLVLAIG